MFVFIHSVDKERVQKHLNTCFKSPPLYLERLLLVVVATLCNVAFAVYELLENSLDFNSHILAVFMINLFVYSGFYVIMKARKKECMTSRLYPFVHLVAAISFWTTGSFFFLQKAAKWEVRYAPVCREWLTWPLRQASHCVAALRSPAILLIGFGD